jgi:hypothetical protein
MPPAPPAPRRRSSRWPQQLPGLRRRKGASQPSSWTGPSTTDSRHKMTSGQPTLPMVLQNIPSEPAHRSRDEQLVSHRRQCTSSTGLQLRSVMLFGWNGTPDRIGRGAGSATCPARRAQGSGFWTGRTAESIWPVARSSAAVRSRGGSPTPWSSWPPNYASYLTGEVISVSGQTRSRYSSTLVPTVFGMNAPGSRAPMACWARQPVQCAGTTTCGFSALRSSMTRGISGSKIGPLR